MGDLAAWGPTIATAIVGIVVLGGMRSTQADHGRRLDAHDELHEEAKKHDSAQDVALAELQAFNRGYAEARALYDRHKS